MGLRLSSAACEERVLEDPRRTGVLPHTTRVRADGGFALQPSQIVELGAAHAPGAHHVDVVDDPGMDGKNTLHALAEADLAHRNALTHTGVVARNHRAFGGLHNF